MDNYKEMYTHRISIGTCSLVFFTDKYFEYRVVEFGFHKKEKTKVHLTTIQETPKLENTLILLPEVWL